MFTRVSLVASLAALLVIGGSATAAPAAPKPVKYKNCAALNKVYPAGVAQSRAAARVAEADGNARPRVAKKVYTLNKRLDRDKDLVACEQPVSSGASSTDTAAPAAPGVTYILSGIPIFDAINQSKADRGEITQAQSNALTRLGGAVVAPNMNTRVKVCPLWGFEVFRSGYLDSAINTATVTAIGLAPTDLDWAKTNLSLAVESYCAS